MLVVGGGDSALEAATSIADEPGTTVTLSYRSEAFSRAKEKNRIRVENAQKAGRLQVLMKSNVKQIADNRRARYDYAIEDDLECGIVLEGSEVKSLREG